MHTQTAKRARCSPLPQFHLSALRSGMLYLMPQTHPSLARSSCCKAASSNGLLENGNTVTHSTGATFHALAQLLEGVGVLLQKILCLAKCQPEPQLIILGSIPGLIFAGALAQKFEQRTRLSRVRNDQLAVVVALYRHLSEAQVLSIRMVRMVRERT